jgi:hypothetical protein
MSVKHDVLAIIAFVGMCVPATGYGAEKFQKLTGPQIRAKFNGMETTDNVHWADVFGSNGGLTSYSMGKRKDGRWRVDKDELCIECGKDEGGCYEVWLSGTKVEFRRTGVSDAAFEGVLQRPAIRNRS